MSRYFVSYYPYTNDISAVYKVVEETAKYYKVGRLYSDSDELKYLNKRSNYLRGSDIKLHELTEEEILRKIKRQRNINYCSHTKWEELTDEQLNKIREILEEKK